MFVKLYSICIHFVSILSRFDYLFQTLTKYIRLFFDYFFFDSKKCISLMKQKRRSRLVYQCQEKLGLKGIVVLNKKGFKINDLSLHFHHRISYCDLATALQKKFQITQNLPLHRFKVCFHHQKRLLSLLIQQRKQKKELLLGFWHPLNIKDFIVRLFHAFVSVQILFGYFF